MQEGEVGSGRDWHERRAAELAEAMEREAVEDYVVDADGEGVVKIAARVLGGVGWLS